MNTYKGSGDVTLLILNLYSKYEVTGQQHTFASSPPGMGERSVPPELKAGWAPQPVPRFAEGTYLLLLP